ncbi:extracellular solute-binding protein [Curvibacter sp. RS43]|uniref:ABC transporter substrate-binding protein n=1 Tax=Curvibacter microcysteis TaxID=3026419 RepID=UPI00235EBB9D|nr:extracellular solute-binding protein [Curvibacter sp. RS43]MDD0808760.1 extracellular solute-binding protein [Curvibacter sp. RS43]
MPINATRRSLWQAGLAHACAGGLMAWGPASAQALHRTTDPAKTLRVLAWPGYADPDVVKAFEDREGARVELSIVGSDESLRQRMALVDPVTGGPLFDVLAANTVELQRLRELQMLAPLSLNSLPNAAAQLPRFLRREAIPGITEGGRLYAMPYTYAEMGLIFDRRQLSTPPQSLTVLWDPALQGRVLAFDSGTHGFSLAAMAHGLSPFQIGAPQWGSMTQRLVDLRRNLRGFYSLPEESAEMFRRHRVAVMFANYGRQQLKLLQDQGLDVGYALPREGALAWLDCWAVTRQARNPDLAARWVNHLLSLDMSRLLTRRHGLANTLEEQPGVPPSGRLVWLEPVENESRRERLWQRIVAGERPERLAA